MKGMKGGKLGRDGRLTRRHASGMPRRRLRGSELAVTFHSRPFCVESALFFGPSPNIRTTWSQFVLTRRGAKNQPFYHVVVTDSRERQGGSSLEQVGYFNPVARGKEQRLQARSRAHRPLGRQGRSAVRSRARAGREVPQASGAGDGLRNRRSWRKSVRRARSDWVGYWEPWGCAAGSRSSRTPIPPRTCCCTRSGTRGKPARERRQSFEVAEAQWDGRWMRASA